MPIGKNNQTDCKMPICNVILFDLLVQLALKINLHKSKVIIGDQYEHGLI